MTTIPASRPSPQPRPPASAPAAVWEATKRLPATVAALTCTGVGIFYNAEFARQYGEAAIALAVASDILKALAGPTVMAAVRAREFGRAGAAFVVLAVTLCFSLVAAFGSAQHRREGVTDERADAIRAFEDAKKRQTVLEAELAQLGNPRPVSVIQAEVQATKIDMRVWRRSNQCADISLDATKAACGPILALYRERGAAARKVEIDAEIATLRPVISRGRPGHADPQSAAIAAVTGLDEDTIRRMISALIVLAIEVGAIGGSIMAARPSPRRTSVPANDLGPVPTNRIPTKPLALAPPKGARRGRKSDQRVVDFSEAFSRKHGRAPSGSEIKTQFPELPTSTAYDYSQRARLFLKADRNACAPLDTQVAASCPR